MMNDPRTPKNGLGISKRSNVRPFVAMDVLAAANTAESEGQKVIHMELGQPTAPTPAAVLAAAEAGLAAGRIGYTEALGIRALRQRIAQHYADTYGLTVDADRIAVTTGSSGAFNLAFLAAFDPGDRVAVTAPGYPAYRNILTALGLEVVEIELNAETGPNVTPEQLEATHAATPLAGLLIASPSNPTGSMLSPDELAALVRTTDALGIRFISDEIYHGLVYAGTEDTALRYSDRAIVVNSFSKYYCMSGWRVGWMVLPEALVRPVERLAQNLYLSPPDLSQRAALGAFEAVEELEAIKAGYARSRIHLLDRLPALGFEDAYPADGAFYVYVSTRRLANDSTTFAQRMLEGAGVAATPGLDFDIGRGSGTMRFSFAGTPEDMAEAMERLEQWLK